MLYGGRPSASSSPWASLVGRLFFNHNSNLNGHAAHREIFLLLRRLSRYRRFEEDELRTRILKFLALP